MSKFARAELKMKQGGASFKCQFNPSTLRTTYTNQFGEDPPQGHARVTTAKLDVELIFDHTDTGASVYGDLLGLEALTRSSAQKDKDKPDGKVPVVEFHWQIKIFEGVIESLTHTIDYWSHDGVPLRATVQISIKETSHTLSKIEERKAARSSKDVALNNQADDTAVIAVPATPKGTTETATQAGNSRAGRTVAAQNGMESMRMGAFAGASASASASASANASASADGEASASASASIVAAVSVSAGAKLGAAASFKASGGVSAGAGAGASLGFGLGAGAGASAGAGIGGAAGIGMSGGASIGAGAGIGIGGGIGIGASAGAGIGIGAGAGIGVGAAAGAGASFSAGAGAFAGIKGSASAGVSASSGAFAGLGSSKMITGNTGMDIAKLMPPPMPVPMGAGAQFDATGKLTNDGSAVVASSYTTETTGFDGSTSRTSSSSVRVM